MPTNAAPPTSPPPPPSPSPLQYSSECDFAIMRLHPGPVKRVSNQLTQKLTLQSDDFMKYAASDCPESVISLHFKDPKLLDNVSATPSPSLCHAHPSLGL